MREISKSLNHGYNVNLTDVQIWKYVCDVFENKYNDIFKEYWDEIIANRLINEIILKYYPGERIVKYHLIKKFIGRKKEVTLFEMYADNSSRVDLCRVNGKSIAYEIKSDLDNLDRLNKQIEDYSKIFEFTYVTTTKAQLSKVLDIIPDFCGVQLYRLEGEKCFFSYPKKAEKSPNIKPSSQVNSLSSKDIEFILKELAFKKIPSTRSEREEALLSSFGEKTINKMFKKAIQNKYKNQWRFIKDNFNSILPIDMQSFFHQNISPQLIYYKSSSKVNI
ncbi:MAG: sce7726 family protein [Firmicutes bacterium]|nr:sce7726 family protein [Bacillota bacterium]